MNQGDITHMAAECLLFEELAPAEFEAALIKFAALVRADEREACAKVCDDWAKTSYLSEAKSCARIIRARGQA